MISLDQISKRPSARWTKNLDSEQDVSDFEDTLRRSQTALRRLKELLEQELAEVNAADCTLKDFDNPNWTYLQAARIGEKTRLAKTLQLLEFLN
jgi:hypothetical protein